MNKYEVKEEGLIKSVMDLSDTYPIITMFTTGENMIHFGSYVRYQAEGIWYRSFLFRSFLRHTDEGPVSEAIPQEVGKFIKDCYIQMLFGKPDKNSEEWDQISEQERFIKNQF